MLIGGHERGTFGAIHVSPEYGMVIHIQGLSIYTLQSRILNILLSVKKRNKI